MYQNIKRALTEKLSVGLNHVGWCGGTAPRRYTPRVFHYVGEGADSETAYNLCLTLEIILRN